MHPDTLTRFRPIRFAVLMYAALSFGAAQAAEEDVVMYKDPNCGCCGQWAEHLRTNGFSVQEVATRDMAAIKREAGLPPELASCHTARVGGYVVEGHVPAADIRRLLAERPSVAGLSAPGMPLGSPGMEGPYPAESYRVLSFESDGRTAVFAEH
ncbi:DUF411 domain-containing protein [Allochromatium humboldtianum]|uniref:DUF411 domain-containing protein n=1 Tax=Allochromatium humboldtianum TaxID=504901 RepID=A0A850RIR9_9GAMM|nr:DUF411 domain-containing protein [Allochromatium humboldtianum]NVZ11377.1 DUF411 domain-containing protein [Allochromatium humboldtianum]